MRQATLSGLAAPKAELHEGSLPDESSTDNEGETAMSPSPFSSEVGLVHHRIAFKTVTRERFKEFLADTIQQCDAVFPDDKLIYLIYDNARPHVRAELSEGCQPNDSAEAPPSLLPVPEQHRDGTLCIQGCSKTLPLVT